MKIAIDVNEAFRPQLTGIGVYAKHLVDELLQMSIEYEICFLSMKNTKPALQCRENVSLKLLRSSSLRSVWSQIRLPVHFMANQYDMFHYLEHKLPPIMRCPSVITIYDLGFLKFPDTIHAVERKRFSFFTKDAVQRATRIIAISHSTKRDICETFKVNPEKIHVVHLGVDHNFYHPHVVPTIRKYPYILSVGTIQPRKNYTMLIRAFKKLCAIYEKEIELVIVGKKGWLWEDIEREANEGAYSERIHLLGYIPDKEMPSLYAGAELFVMPSLYEGFGIPLLEAMACGKAVIASNVSSLPEIVGDAGILLDPKDGRTWISTMYDLLNNNNTKNEFGEKALSKSKQFSWEKMAKETLGVYQKVLAG